MSEQRLDALLLSDEGVAPGFKRNLDWMTLLPRASRSSFLWKHGSWPSAGSRQLALAMLTGALRDAGLSVRTLDNFLRFSLRREEFLETLRRDRPRVVGISTSLLLWPAAILEACRLIRENSPDSAVVLGGSSVAQFEEIRQAADVCVVSGGVRGMVAACRAARGEASWQSVPGAFVKDASGALVRSADPGWDDLSSTPLPAWDYGDKPAGPGLYFLETQRGCPYHCAFCTFPVYQGPARQKPMERVLQEIRRNGELFGINEYFFIDSTFTAPRSHALEFCRSVAGRFPSLRWGCYARADNLDAELCGALKDAGCRFLYIGMESGDQGMLDAMKKDCDLRAARDGLKAAREAGLALYVSFLAGFPGETEQTLRNTREFLKETKPHLFGISPFWMDDNAPVGSQREPLGLQGERAQWSHRTWKAEELRATAKSWVADIIAARECIIGNIPSVAEWALLGVGLERALGLHVQTSILVGGDIAASLGRRELYPEAERKDCLASLRKAVQETAARRKALSTDLGYSLSPGRESPTLRSLLKRHAAYPLLQSNVR